MVSVRKAVPILIVASSVLLLVVGLAGLAIYRASKSTPRFYEQALARDTASQQQASEEFLQQATALASDIEINDRWQVAFTADQINGWLAVDVPKNMPEALPPEIRDPRVEIRPGQGTIACRLRTDAIDAVVSISVNVFVSAPNEIAIRFEQATIGALPVPLSKVIEPLGQAAAQMNLQLSWRQQDGYPVAVILLDDASSEDRHALELEAIELRDNELLIAGQNGKRKRVSEPVVQDDEPPTKAASASKTKRQR
jgi:hypothetical protein